MANRLKVAPLLALGLLLFLLAPVSAHADPISAIIIALTTAPSISAAVGAVASIAVIGSLTIGGIVSGIVTGLSIVSSLNGFAQSKKRARSSQDLGQRNDDLKQNITSTVGYVPVVYGRAKVGGLVTYIEAKNGTLYMVIVMSEGAIDSFETIYFDGTPSTDAKYNGLVTKIEFTSGGQNNFPDWWLNEAPNFTNDMYYTGFAGIAFKFQRNQDAFPNIPNITAVVKGRTVLDPRTSTTAWSDNPMLCIYDYLTNTRYGASIATALIDINRLNASANYCDEMVGTAKRFTLNGVVKTEDRVIDVIGDLLTSCNGFFYYSAGQYVADVMRLTTKIGLIDESVILELPSIQYGGKKNKYNAVDAEYTDPLNEWQTNVFPITNSEFLTADNNIPNTYKLSLPYTTGQAETKRLANLAMRQSRLSKTIAVATDCTSIKYSVGDVLGVSYKLLKWVSVPFRVVGIELLPDGSVKLTLQEYDADVYSDVDVTPSDLGTPSGLEKPSSVLPPSPVSISETLIGFGSAGIQSLVSFSWEESLSPFIQNYEIEVSPKGLDTYKTLAVARSSPVEVKTLEIGAYNFRIKAINSLGFSSPWAVATLEVQGLKAPPQPVPQPYLEGQGDLGVLRWAIHPDLDVKSGGRVHIRHVGDTALTDWSLSRLLDIVDGSSTQCLVPVLKGTYLLKAEDSTGNLSATVASVATNQTPNLIGKILNTTLNISPSFNGTYDGFYLESNNLNMLLSGINWDDATGNWDDRTGSFDGDAGQYVLNAIYDCSDFVDVTTSQAVLLKSELETSVSQAGYNWDDAVGDWDDAIGTFDLNIIPPVDFTVFVATTNDNPSGSPTWSDWQVLTQGTFIGRGFKFRLVAKSASSELQGICNSMLVKVYT